MFSGQADLTEGDVVIMGHPNGERLAPGTRVRQPDSEYQYIVSSPIGCRTVMYFFNVLFCNFVLDKSQNAKKNTVYAFVT